MKSKAKKMLNRKSNKKTRGYRLKPETHKLIGKIQELLNSDQDEATACRTFYLELQKTGAQNK
jgi:hypothetical protein